MARMAHRATEELFAGLDAVRAAPADNGTVELIVRRPALGAREIVAEAELHPDAGLVGDSWKERGSRHTDDGSAEPDRQLTLMNARAIRLFAGDDTSRWAEAGDQLFVDLDLSASNLPPGTQLLLGTAVVEVTEKPHTGCPKFSARFGADALRFVATPEGRELHVRGINARVVQAGTVALGDTVVKLNSTQ